MSTSVGFFSLSDGWFMLVTVHPHRWLPTAGWAVSRFFDDSINALECHNHKLHYMPWLMPWWSNHLIYSRVFSPFHIAILWLGFCRGLTVHNRAYDVEVTGPHHWCLKCSCCLSPHCIDDATRVGPLPNGLSQNWGPQVIVSKCPISHVSMFNNL